MTRGIRDEYNRKRVVHIPTESIDPVSMNPAANQIPNAYDPGGIAEVNHNERLLKNGLHVR